MSKREFKFNLGHDSELTFPFTQSVMNNLGGTKLVSPRVGNNHGYQEIGVDSEECKEQMEDVERVRYEVDKNIWPGWFLEKNGIDPKLSPIIIKQLRVSERNPKSCANLVKMDHPFDIWDVVIEPWTRSEKIEWDVQPEHSGNPFVEIVLRRSQAHEIIAKALDKAFDVKYYYGCPRPIEFSDWDKNLEMYGTPNHPELPAGHGAFVGAAAKVFEKMFNPTDAQIKMVQTATKQFAMFRSFSGMHIAYSNLLGWQIGYES